MEALVGLVGLGLAAPGVVDVLIRAGLEIEAKIKTYEHIDDTLERFQKLGVDMARGDLKSQLAVITMARRDERVDRDLVKQLDECFRAIVEDIIKADKEIKRVYPSGFLGKIKYVFVDNVKLKSRLDSLETQRTAFLTSAQYVHIQQNGPPPTQLSSHEFTVIHETASQVEGTRLPSSDIFVVQAEVKINDMVDPEIQEIVLEKRLVSKSGLENAGILAQRLRAAQSSEGILSCLGYRQNPYNLAQCELIFRLPAVHPRQSLLNCIRETPIPSLTRRVKLCQQLARAISQVHSIGLVHKNIRPGNVLLVGEVPSQALFLTDWTLVRRVHDPSSRTGTMLGPKSIYQHPDRQGEHAEHRYTIAHDIYSLGVCMLEMLIWEPLVTEADDGSSGLSSVIYEQAFELGKAQGVPDAELGSSVEVVQRPALIKDTILDLAEKGLPGLVGDTLAGLVADSLHGFEGAFGDGNTNNNSNANLPVNVEDGMKYIQKVLLVLNGISI